MAARGDRGAGRGAAGAGRGARRPGGAEPGALRRLALRRGARRHDDGAAPQALPCPRRLVRPAACRDPRGRAAACRGLQRRPPPATCWRRSPRRSAAAGRARRSPASPRGIGAPRALRELGLAEADLDRAADLAVEAPYSNPRPVERAAVRRLLAAAWAGEPPSRLMALAGREIAVVGAGIGGLAAAMALARRGARVTRLRAGAGARRGRRRHPDRAERGRGARGARACATRPRRARACPRRSSCATIAAGRLVARLPLGAAVVAALRAALLAVPPRRPPRRARRRRRPRPGSSSGSATRVARGRAGRPTGFACGPRTARARRRRSSSRPTACARGCGPRTSPAPPARFTGHVAWRGLVAGGAAAGGLRRAGDRA